MHYNFACSSRLQPTWEQPYKASTNNILSDHIVSFNHIHGYNHILHLPTHAIPIPGCDCFSNKIVHKLPNINGAATSNNVLVQMRLENKGLILGNLDSI